MKKVYPLEGIHSDTEMGPTDVRLFLTPEDGYYSLSFANRGSFYQVAGWDLEHLENLADMISSTLIEMRAKEGNDNG